MGEISIASANVDFALASSVFVDTAADAADASGVTDDGAVVVAADVVANAVVVSILLMLLLLLLLFVIPKESIALSTIVII